jgi:hypothetical protein
MMRLCGPGARRIRRLAIIANRRVRRFQICVRVAFPSRRRSRQRARRVAQGDLDGALQSFREGLGTFQRLARFCKLGIALRQIALPRCILRISLRQPPPDGETIAVRLQRVREFALLELDVADSFVVVGKVALPLAIIGGGLGQAVANGEGRLERASPDYLGLLVPGRGAPCFGPVRLPERSQFGRYGICGRT